MDGGENRELRRSNVAVIREVYDGHDSQQYFQLELEKALDSCCSVIIIEPTQLGDETAHWITMGNFLHKAAVVTGVTSIVSGFAWTDSCMPQMPLAGLSLVCTSLYTASWQFDPCVKYQVERDPRKLSRLPILGALTAASPVVLVRKDDTRRKILHCTISLAAAAICFYRLYWK
ncbi:transmembrane protein 11-A, mitochondrial [Cylas formicarius]|uniref:transmembrane protein 11-A, mitochondrial n=1 Tax=Cylas formicarius TaxID=197179 RepID=UPI0029585408|nr:transmembrane protein 11-A, mitochondrial [Cylas formicarius]